MDSLYQLSALQGAINRAIDEADGDVEEAGVEALLDENYPKLLDKLRAYGYLIELSEIQLAELDHWAARINLRRSGLGALVGDLRRRMAEGMQRAEVKKVDGVERPLDTSRVVDLARKAAALKKATDRAQRNEVLDELLEVLEANRPPVSWKLKIGRGKVVETEDFDIDRLRAWAMIEGIDLVVVPEPTIPAPRVDKKLAGELLRKEKAIPGLELRKEASVDAGA